MPQYGANVTLEQARKAAAAADAEARKNGWPMAIAVVDNATSDQDGQCAKAGADAVK